jgi:Tol biopolymer transport system component
MTLTPGTRLGPYEITSPLGAGGMGEVYRAADTKLKREVAVKVLPEALAQDPERLARFEREAQVLASLNHPHVAAIYGVEDSTSVKALVMELVDGATLQDRLDSGPIAVEEALPIARQIAEALEAAHEKGIVHRDLKPANVKITSDGVVKVLDFGLAKAMDPAMSSAPDMTRSPTISIQATAAGIILGTAAYMSPEQARGSAVDKRADIWAFGVVVYEMLTGKRLFHGETVSDTLAAVLRADVDLEALPAGVPPEIRRLLRRCLERNPKNRLHDVADARILIEEVLSGRVEEDGAPAAGLSEAPRRSRRLTWALAATTVLATAAAVALALARLRSPRSEPARALRLEVTPPETSSPTNRGGYFELSPDGRFLAMVEDGELWVRPLDAAAARRIEGIEDASYPFWSPDGAWIGFFEGGELRKVARDGGRAQKICAAPGGRGATWSPEGVIVFSDHYGDDGLSRVSAQGGTPTAVTRTAGHAGIEVHRYPQFLPDGKSFLFLDLAPSPELSGVYLGTLGGGKPKRVLESTQQAIYARAGGNGAGYLFYTRDKALMAQPFDLASRKTSGEVLPIAEGVGVGANTGAGAFTLSGTGLLASSTSTVVNSEMVWFDRSGKRGDRLGKNNGATGDILGLSIAPGGRRVAFGIGDPPNIFVQSLPDGEPSRFTFAPAPGFMDPIWSPDGSEIAYATQDLAGLPVFELRRRRADRAGSEETLVKSKKAIYPWDWSPDGRSIVYGDWDGKLWSLPLEGDRKPVPYITTPGSKAYAQFSPDGRLVAYASDEQGHSEVFVATVPQNGALWQISSGGGSMPRWRRDGRELYYRADDGALMAVALGSGSGAAAIDGRTAARPLFAGIPSSGNTWIFTYAPAADGQRFLVATARKGAQPPIHVLVNWPAAIAKRSHGGAP